MNAKHIVTLGLIVIATYAAGRIAYESVTEGPVPAALPSLNRFGGNMSTGIVALGALAGIQAFWK